MSYMIKTIRKLKKKLKQAKAERDELLDFSAIILCWKPEWTQTPYFEALIPQLQNDLVRRAKEIRLDRGAELPEDWLEALPASLKERIEDA